MIYLLLETDLRLATKLMREIMQLGYEAVWSQRHEDARRLLNNESMDLVVLALTPRDVTALQMLSWLHENRRGIPVLALLDGKQPAELNLALETGASACVVKPFGPEAFRSQTRSLLL